MLRVIIAGGRDFDDYGLLRDRCNFYLQKYLDFPFCDRYSEVEIVSGGAKGADALGWIYASHSGFSKKLFKADWDNLDIEPCKIRYNRYNKPYNALAGHNRNKQMGDYADVLIAFWNKESNGTKGMIEYMRKLNKPTRVIKHG